MKVLIVADLHLSDRPPSLRTDSYLDDIFAKLEQTVKLENSRDFEAVVWAGDIFHSKIPHRTSHSLVRQVIDLGARYKSQWYIVPGNHDISHDRLDSIPTQPLGTVFASGHAKPLIGHADNLNLCGIPYLQDWTTLHQVMDDLWGVGSMSVPPGNEYLLVTHAPIMPPGVTQPYEFIAAEDWAKIQGEGSCYYGHIHDNHGIYTAGSVLFANHGAISRASLHESDLKREPAATIFTNDPEPKFQRVPLKVRPIRDVMRVAEHESEEVRQDRLDEFLTKVGSTDLDVMSPEKLLSTIEEMDIPPGAKAIVRECLELAISK